MQANGTSKEPKFSGKEWLDMNKTLAEKKDILRNFGAEPSDMESLLKYTDRVFGHKSDVCKKDDEFIKRWDAVFATSETNGAAVAINKHIANSEFQISFDSPESVSIELFSSIAGTIPVIKTNNTDDFESIINNVVFKGKPNPHIKNVGAHFAFGVTNRFLVLSGKRYSNLPASYVGIDENEWLDKSMVIRRYHEIAHYYTKRFYNSARNNLHDELIADFYGFWKAFSKFDADVFQKCLAQGRMATYTDKLSTSAAKIVKKLATAGSEWIEKWTASDEFTDLDEARRIDYLCKMELLDFTEQRS